MSEVSPRFSTALPDPVRDALYVNYPTYRAVIAILDGISELPDLSMRARLAQTTTHAFYHPILDFMIDEGRLFLFRITCPDRIFLRFSARTDLHRVLEAARPEGVIFGPQLAANPKGWPIYLEMTAAIDASKVDYQRIADVLPTVLAHSPTRRVVRRSGDTELQALLREMNNQQEDYLFEHIIEDILDHINENNFDEVLDSLPDYDPNAEEDPMSVPTTELILMDSLVRERGKLIDKVVTRLPDLREKFEQIGEGAKCDIQELEGLTSYIEKKLW